MSDFDEITVGLNMPKLPGTEGKRTPVLLVVGGPRTAIGRAYRIVGDLLIGRAGEADVWLDEDGISRRHTRVSAKAGGASVVDLNSRNGTWLNGKRVSSADLKEGDLLQFGATHILRLVFQDQLDEAAHRTLVDGAIRDSLTGAYNRGYFFDQLRKDLSSSMRHKQHLSLAAMDLDHFKSINDRYGHAMGDLVLRHVSRAVSNLVRSEDTFGRIGGEEFGVILRSCPLGEADRVLNRIRETVASLDLMHGDQSVAVTVSIGVAAIAPGSMTSATELMAVADKALYVAKHAGRNRVALAGAEDT